ncbi:hypothetical protein [Vulgatibacter sp.]|uniref:hypothetical protein n=1 Tax=Vulgatibacter sp. TaxID=1971226 RepID=UPI003565B417
MERIGLLAAVRKTPEVILWALAIFVCGVVVLPVLHLAGHRLDHVHGAAAAHQHAHEAGLPHGDAEHGAGELAHFGLALLEVEPPALLPPEAAQEAAALLPPARAPQRRSLLTPIRPGAP